MLCRLCQSNTTILPMAFSSLDSSLFLVNLNHVDVTALLSITEHSPFSTPMQSIHVDKNVLNNWKTVLCIHLSILMKCKYGLYVFIYIGCIALCSFIIYV
jgi:hypothetical protein